MKNFRDSTFARISQLGPCDLFFTLSCAEQRWDEVKMSLLQLNGHEITIIVDNEDEPQFMVDGVPLEDYVEANKKEMADIYRDKFIYVSRLFDDRFKAFKNQFLEKGDVAHYCYRVEFQARGKLIFLLFYFLK